MASNAFTLLIALLLIDVAFAQAAAVRTEQSPALGGHLVQEEGADPYIVKTEFFLRRVLAEVQAEEAKSGPGKPVAAITIPGVVEVRESGQVHVTLRLTAVTDNVLQQLRDANISIEAINGNVVTTWLDPGAVEKAAGMHVVTFIARPHYARRRTGGVTTQGDSVHRAAVARLSGSTGLGVVVGVISDGVSNRHQSVATGDLPASGGIASININPSLPGPPSGPNGADEGTAMLEIIHDIAPGASLAFSSAMTSADMISSVAWLQTVAGARVICDDLGFYDEPFFSDGQVAQAVRGAIDAGVTFVSAAGNDARLHYQAPFSPSVVVHAPITGPAGWTVHGWNASGDYSLDIAVPASTSARSFEVFLQWDEAFGASATNFDMYLVDASESSVIASSATVQSGFQDPSEYINVQMPPGPSVGMKLWVRRLGVSSQPGTLEMFLLGDVAMSEYVTELDSIFGHSAVPGVVAVAAMDQANGISGCDVEVYSSRGPSTIAFPNFQIRATPAITGVDAVSVTGAGGFSNIFRGTSAAAPHVAAIAALIGGSNPALSDHEVREIMYQSARTCGTWGSESSRGAGLADAGAAVGLALPGAYFASSFVAWGNNQYGECTIPGAPSGVTYSRLVGGHNHSAALRSDGAIVAWGRNQYGQCNVPALPPSLRYLAVAAGGFTTVALRSDGAMVSWGQYAWVQLPPVGGQYVQVSRGYDLDTFALRDDGIIDQWGGIGSPPGLPNGVVYVEVSAGSYHAVARRSDGLVVAWGSNMFGQCNVPSLPAGLRYTRVSAGRNHSLACRSDGALIAWGYNSSGQCNVPALPQGLSYTDAIAAWSHSVARRSDGSVVAWGDNILGQTIVPAGLHYASIGGGSYHTIGRVDDTASALVVGSACGAGPQLRMTRPGFGEGCSISLSTTAMSLGCVYFSGVPAGPTGIGGGCTAYLDLLGLGSLGVIVTDSSGNGSIAFVVPPDPGLLAARLVLQAVVLPGVSLFGFDLSNGVKITVGY